MKYKIGDIVSVYIEIFKDGKKKISIKPPKEDSKLEILQFPIVAIDIATQSYKIIIDPDISGWDISKFHTKYQRIDEKYLNKRFYDISEIFIIEKK